MAASESYREELRQAVLTFQCGKTSMSAPMPGHSTLPSHINLYLFGPQGSGKTSFVRTCFRALYGRRNHNQQLAALETTLHKSDDGTSQYSVYSLTDRVCLHDTRGQREYTPEEMQQLKLVLEGRARPNVLVQQRRRYWLLLREFWRTDEQMRRTFSRTVLLPKASLETEPHFSFLVLDPNQQELLLEDEDFRMCYGSLIGDFSDRGVPHALLCTHGDTLNPGLRAALLRLPALLGCGAAGPLGAASQQQGPGGVLRPSSSGPYPGGGGGAPPKSSSAAASNLGATGVPFGGSNASSSSAPKQPQRMPDIMRIVTNYVDGSAASGVERDAEGNDLQQDIHTLLVLLDALRQADNQIMQRITGRRPAPMPPEAENGCPLL